MNGASVGISHVFGKEDHCMDHKEILKRVDHTLLTQTATWAEVQALCDEAMA